MLDIVSIPRAISEIAGERPDDPAILVDGKSCTWAQLDGLSSLAAAGFVDAGVQRGDLVAVAARNDVNFFVTVLASYKLGGVPMPVSSRLTSRERREILAVARPRLLVGFDSADQTSQSVRSLDGLWTESGDSRFESSESQWGAGDCFAVVEGTHIGR